MPTWHAMDVGDTDSIPPLEPEDYEGLSWPPCPPVPAAASSPGLDASPPTSLTSPTPLRWRCLRCGGYLWWLGNVVEVHEVWKSEEFYEVSKPQKVVQPNGTWLFMPQGHEVLSSRPRRRRHRPKHGYRPPPDEPSFEGREAAESEALTNDPCVDPDVVNRALPRDPVLPPRQAASTSSTDERALVKALKELFARYESRLGAAWRLEPGQKWKSGTPPTPPVWRFEANDLRTCAKFTKKVNIWQLQMSQYASRREQALLLYNSLTGEPEQELEHLTIDDIYVEDGVEKILRMLQAPMEQKTVFQKRTYFEFADFENIRRYPGELTRTFVNRFRRCQRNLLTLRIDISATYDNEALGSRFWPEPRVPTDARRDSTVVVF